MREVLYYTIHCPLIIQKDLDLWKLDFSLSILLYRETCNMYHLFTVFTNSFFWCIPTHEEKLFVHTFHGILSIFLKTPTLFFFIFFRYHFHWYSIRYGNYLRWGSQQLDMNVNNKLNNSMYLCQNIIRADSENFFNGGGKGLQTLISRTQKLFAANYFLTIPPKLPPPALLAVTQIFHYEKKSADECRTDMWSCQWWWELSVCHRVTPLPFEKSWSQLCLLLPGEQA